MDWFEIVKGAEEDAERFYDKTMRIVMDFADTSVEEIKESLDRINEMAAEQKDAWDRAKGTLMEDVLKPMHDNLTRRNKALRDRLSTDLDELLALRDMLQELDAKVSSAPIRQRLMVIRNNMEGLDDLSDFIDVEELDKIIADLGFENMRDEFR